MMVADDLPAHRTIAWMPYAKDLIFATKDVLFISPRHRLDIAVQRSHKLTAAALAAFFTVLFPILLLKSIALIESQPDQHYHQGAFDYSFDWATPSLGLAGNLLYNFGIQIPLNAHLAPLLGLARALSRQHQIFITLSLYYLTTALTIWCVGRMFGLRIVPRMVLAGVAGLIVTVPGGLDAVLFVVPSFVNHLLMCGLWWHEAALMAMAAVLLFFLIGRTCYWGVNIILGVGFCLLSVLALFSFAEGAFFIVPIILFYCLGFTLGSEAQRELAWKLSIGGAFAIAMLALRVPSFFQQLYSYTWGAYFPGFFKTDMWTLMQSSTSIIALSYDFRMPIFFIVALATISFSAVMASGPLKRIASAALLCEAGILLAAGFNALTVRHGIKFFYSEMLQLPLLATFFVLFWLFGCTAAGIAVRNSILSVSGLSCPSGGGASLKSGLDRRILWTAWTIVVFALVRVVTLPDLSSFQAYPAKRPLSVQIIRRELALKAGEPFRGRLLTLGGMLGNPGVQWPGGPGSILDVLENQYKVPLGNDHYINMLPLEVPIGNEFGHWTSPITFVFLKSFFGRADDLINNKAFFPLRRWNERIARLMGIRMIVTDTPEIQGGELVFAAKTGTADLRVFRLEQVNLGQYSPTRPLRIDTAVEAITLLGASSFDPEHDVVIEEKIPDLVPAKAVSVTTDFGPKLSIHAESSGLSLLALPFEFSHCLRLVLPRHASARLIPVNLQQIGILFDRHITAEISYSFAPFADCRRKDLERADRLRLRDAL